MDLELENKMLKDEIKKLKLVILDLTLQIPVKNSRGAGRKSSIPNVVVDVCQLKNAGFTYVEISNKLCISKSYVAKILKSEGY